MTPSQDETTTMPPDAEPPQTVPLVDPLTQPGALAVPDDPLPPVDATQQTAMDVQAKAAVAPWSIKPQEVTDKHSGLTLTFGNHVDSSNTVYLILAHNGLGSLITFQRDGEVLKCMPLTTPTNAQKDAIAKAQEAENPKLHTPDAVDPADTGGSALADQHRPEPWVDNKLAGGANIEAILAKNAKDAKS